MTSSSTHNAWGRPVAGQAPAQPLDALVGKFREAGLGESDAHMAAQGLRDGLYVSFTDAAVSRTVFGSPATRRGVSAARVAEVAKTLQQGAVVSGPRGPGDGTNQLVEVRTAAQVRPQLLERASAQISGDGRLKVCLISEGQGSSGYYPASTLQEAATSGVFAAGTHCYVDHPTHSEAIERPERSVRDLAGVLETAATYRQGALYADVRVFASHRDLITDRASAIGMSIRGDGIVERKDVDGFTRSVVTSMSRIDSIDFVTQAGRGGRILDVA